MTESLTERLRQKAASQISENQQILSEELERLSSGMRKQLNGELVKMQKDIADRSESISADLEMLSTISRRWMIAGGALIAGLVILLCFFAWLLIQSHRTEPPNGYQTFVQDGQTYLVFPPGSEFTSCTWGEKKTGCVVIVPSGK